VSRPSFKATLNNWCYGPLIGRRDLSREQWNDILRQAFKMSWMPFILPSLGTALLIIALKCAYYFTVTSMNITPDMTVPQMQAAIDLLQLRMRWMMFAVVCGVIIAPLGLSFLHRRLAAPHIRAAANAMGLTNLCTRCGYNLTGLPATTSNCPECGTPIQHHAPPAA